MYVNQNKSSNSIAKIFKCDSSTILRQLKRWNVHIRRKRYNAKYDLECDFFKNIDTEEKAYFLGLLLADGHISKK